MSDSKPRAPAAEVSREEILRLLRKRDFDLKAVRAMGEMAVPTLVEVAFGDSNSALVRKNAIEAALEIAITDERACEMDIEWEKLSLDFIKALDDKRPYIRDFAMTMITRATEGLDDYDWRSAGPGLVRGLKLKETRTAAALALQAIGETEAALGRREDWGGVAIALIKYLRDEDPDVRGSAARALGYVGKAEQVSAVIECLKDGNKFVRDEVAEALTDIAREMGIDLRLVGKKLEEFVNSVKAKGNHAEVGNAEKEAGGYYMRIAGAARERSAGRHALAGDGVALEPKMLKQPSDKRGMYRAGKTRAIA